jgi:integrase
MPKQRGFGTTRKLPSGRWQASYSWNGKRFNAPHTYPNKTQAINWLAQEETKRLNGTWSAPTVTNRVGFLFEDFAKHFVENRLTQGRPIRPSTKDLYFRLLRVKFSAFKGHDVTLITKQQVDDWYASESATGKITSTRNAYKLLKAMMADLVTNGHRLDNPCQKKGMTKAATGIKKYTPSMTQVRQVSKLIARPDFRFMTDLMGFAGLRFAEAAGLQKRDFRKASSKNGDYYEVRIDKQVQYFARAFHWGPPKSDEGNRTIVLPTKMTAEVDAHLATLPKAGKSLVFHDGNGQPLRNDIYARYLKAAIGQVGLDGLHFTPHSLRHGGATAISQNGSVAEVQKFLGDSSPTAAIGYMDGGARQAQLMNEIFVEAIDPED